MPVRRRRVFLNLIKIMGERLPSSRISSFNEKLRALESIGDELPCVVILLKLPDLSVEYMSRPGLTQLGTTLNEIKALGGGYMYKYFNKEDVDDYAPKILAFIEKNEEHDILSFFQQVRFEGHPDWHWHLSNIKVFAKDETGIPTHMIVTAHTVNSIGHVNAKVNRLLEENNFFRANQNVFLSLTRREREVLRLLALGNDSNEIADKLYISAKTVKTHRKNLRKKLNAQSGYDITRFAQAFDMI